MSMDLKLSTTLLMFIYFVAISSALKCPKRKDFDNTSEGSFASTCHFLEETLVNVFNYANRAFASACQCFMHWLKIFVYRILCAAEKCISLAKCYVRPNQMENSAFESDFRPKDKSFSIFMMVGKILLIPGVITILTFIGFVFFQEYKDQISNLINGLYELGAGVQN
ncbi:uncharacterized protein LOC111637639 [Centruroides sculpturatus]|uniref:uncharacterized protein LOC111637639 n=1 Tax=Centruroides sculpturatus TaxID=218467 RepID=UPI000C6EF9F3|nr:uncharacterized protein LOC111637639 [Centruroides sculpturatus]